MNRRSLFRSLAALVAGAKAAPAASLRISPPIAADQTIDAGIQAILDRNYEKIRLMYWGFEGQILTLDADGKIFWRTP